MPYAQAVTYIHELPPLSQQSAPQSSDAYYDEVVKDHPSVQSKIRKTDTGIDALAKYEDTFGQAPPLRYLPPGSPPPPAGDRAVPLPDYPVRGTPPASVSQNYLNSNMVAGTQMQHLPVANAVPIHYNRPLGSAGTETSYPVMEALTNVDCKTVWEHMQNCPVCSRMYQNRQQNEHVYMLIIGLLVLFIFFIVYRMNGKL